MAASRRAWLLPTLAMLPALAVLVLLGTWQLERKSWKEALIAIATSRAFGQAQPLAPQSALASLDPDAIDFERVSLRGTFRAQEFHLFGIREAGPGHAEPEPGWFVYAPVDVEGGGVVIVDRGFVPMEEKGAAAARRPPEGEIAIEGIVRRAEARTLFSAADDPEKNAWYTRDAHAFATGVGLADAAPFTVEQATPNPTGRPIVDPPRVTFPNRHLEYAITWYGLALTLIGVWAAFVWGRMRRVGV